MDDDRRKPGRPRAKDAGVAMTTWISQHHYARICKLAAKREESVSALIRGVVVLSLRLEGGSTTGK